MRGPLSAYWRARAAPTDPWAPYGYEVTGRRAERSYVIDPPAAAIVRSMFSDYLEGRSLNALALELNERGVTGPKGGGWSRQRVKTILDNPAYAGFRIYRGEEFEARWEPLESRQLWDEVRDKRHRARTTYNDPPGRANSLLAGLLVCGVCRRNFHRGRLNDRGAIYRCTTGDATPHRCGGGQIGARKAETLVTDAVFEVLALARDHALVQRAAEIRRSYPAAKIAERRALLGEVAERVVVIARPPGNRHSKGTAIGRSLEVSWSRAWSLGSFGYVGATSLLTPRRPSVQSPVGKSWKQWRELRILAPTMASVGKRS
jgi:Recombinase/Recombinase zinc beta ribbon domain